MLARSIERLSSGLRINHAADDASGLAISEKLRTQIRGIAKASLNAQDAISYLQTGEGGLEILSDILQRMRELAVQAGNGTYTSNDRKELQKEVDQLKAEVNRVSASTEYNTKKLLTGAASALWSSSSPIIQGIVRGAPAEGNYRLDITTDPGRNAIYKSDIMDVIKDGVKGTPQGKAVAIITDMKGITGITTAEYLEGPLNEKFTLTVRDATTNPITSGIREHSIAAGSGNINEYTAAFNSTGAIGTNAYLAVEFLDTVTSPLSAGSTVNVKFTYATISAGTVLEKYASITVGTDFTPINGANFFDGVTIGGGVSFKLESGTTLQAGSKVAVILEEAAPAGYYVTLENSQYSDTYKGGYVAASAGGHDIFTMKNVSVDEDISFAGFSINVSGALVDGTTSTLKAMEGIKSTNISAQYLGGKEGVYMANTVSSTGTIAGSWVHSSHQRNTANNSVSAVVTGIAALNPGNPPATGYLVFEVLQDYVSMVAGDSVMMKATYINASTGDRKEVTQSFSQGPNTLNLGEFGSFNITIASVATFNLQHGDKTAFTWQNEITNTYRTSISSPDSKYVAAGANSGNASIGLAPGVTTNVWGLAKVGSGNLETVGVAIKASQTLQAANEYISISSNILTSAGGVASLDTSLGQIGRFTNADGRMILENTQELFIYGNGKQTSVFLQACDTVQDLRDRLNKAILDLGMGATAASAGSQEEADKINANLVQYVTEENKSEFGNRAVEGTFIIQSALRGANSEIHFIGDENLVNALSLATIQAATRSQSNVSVYNAHTNELIGNDKVCDGMLRGMIKGIDVKIDSTIGTKARWDSSTGTIIYSASIEPQSAYLHVVDNRTEIQVGANEGQKFDISISQMDLAALELEDVYVMTLDLSQKAMTKLDMALERINSARASIGAQINRLEFTMKNLSVARTNLIASESRIRDLDVAAESALFTRNQILVNAATAMLAQANALPQTALQLIGGR
jgi:flagellin-like hook-associated protein FlgL